MQCAQDQSGQTSHRQLAQLAGPKCQAFADCTMVVDGHTTQKGMAPSHMYGGIIREARHHPNIVHIQSFEWVKAHRQLSEEQDKHEKVHVRVNQHADEQAREARWTSPRY